VAGRPVVVVTGWPFVGGGADGSGCDGAAVPPVGGSGETSPTVPVPMGSAPSAIIIGDADVQPGVVGQGVVHHGPARRGRRKHDHRQRCRTGEHSLGLDVVGHLDLLAVGSDVRRTPSARGASVVVAVISSTTTSCDAASE